MMTGCLRASFTRRRGRRDRVEVTRSDGTSLCWDFPSYGDALPHDLCHLIVEAGLRMTDGFWGFVDQGVDVLMIEDQAILTRDGKPLAGQPGVDFTGLAKAEQAVALLGPQPTLQQVGRITIARLTASVASDATPQGDVHRLGFRLPDTATPDAVASIKHRLQHLAQQWQDLEDDQSIAVIWRIQAPPPTDLTLVMR